MKLWMHMNLYYLFIVSMFSLDTKHHIGPIYIVYCDQMHNLLCRHRNDVYVLSIKIYFNHRKNKQCPECINLAVKGKIQTTNI